MATSQEIEKVASLLFDSAQSKSTVPPVREIIGDSDVDAAYAAQEINIKKRIAAGETIVGKKIGLTSFAVQEQLGVDQPDYGILFNTMEVKNGVLPYSELMQPKAEAEIAFVMAEDLEGDINISDLIDAIEYATVSIEIVGSRVAEWNIRITDTIADNASASHFILGESKVSLDDIDLAGCTMTMTRNGDLASEGNGAACMDNPLNAALWLAQKMSEQGSPIQKGDILLSGALGPMVPIEQGDEFEASIEGLGSITLKIS
jgi:2-keto-4-pentenoate hydratase